MIKFIHLPVHIWNMAELQPGQRVLLALVHGFTASGRGLTMSNSALGDVLGVSPRTVRRWLSQLTEMGHVRMSDNDGQRVVILSRGVDTALSGGGGHSYVHHIVKNNSIDTNHNNGKEMKRPTVDQVTEYLMTTPPVQTARMGRGDVKRVAADAVQYYEANEWRTAQGHEVTQWRGVMVAWVKRVLKDYRPRQQRPQADPDQLRRDIAWHTKRMLNYECTGRAHLAASEAHSIHELQQQLKQMGHEG